MNLKVGDKVVAVFRKYGKHKVVGKITEISTDEHGLPGTWVSIRVSGGDIKDRQVVWLIQHSMLVMIPIEDVKGVVQDGE